MAEEALDSNLESPALFWARRRWAYNFHAVGCAIVGSILFFGAMMLPGNLKNGEDAVEPMGLFCGLFLFPFVINAGYSLGEPVERWLSRRLGRTDLAPTLYRAGQIFTAAVFLFPASVAAIAYLVKR